MRQLGGDNAGAAPDQNHVAEFPSFRMVSTVLWASVHEGGCRPRFLYHVLTGGDAAFGMNCASFAGDCDPDTFSTSSCRTLSIGILRGRVPRESREVFGHQLAPDPASREMVTASLQGLWFRESAEGGDIWQ